MAEVQFEVENESFQFLKFLHASRRANLDTRNESRVYMCSAGRTICLAKRCDRQRSFTWERQTHNQNPQSCPQKLGEKWQKASTKSDDSQIGRHGRNEKWDLKLFVTSWLSFFLGFRPGRACILASGNMLLKYHDASQEIQIYELLICIKEDIYCTKILI